MAIVKEVLLNFDKIVFSFFQKLQCPCLDCVLVWPSRIGDVLPLLSILVALILIFDRIQVYRKIAMIVTGILLTDWATILLKLLFQRERPYFFAEQVHGFFCKFPAYSLPSGHASVAFATAFLLNHLYPKKMWWTYIVAAWIAVSRAYVGAHYPSDILAGIILGIGCAALVCKVMPLKNSQDHTSKL